MAISALQLCPSALGPQLPPLAGACESSSGSSGALAGPSCSLRSRLLQLAPFPASPALTRPQLFPSPSQDPYSKAPQLRAQQPRSALVFHHDEGLSEVEPHPPGSARRNPLPPAGSMLLSERAGGAGAGGAARWGKPAAVQLPASRL